jgi:hypothetical protein
LRSYSHEGSILYSQKPAILPRAHVTFHKKLFFYDEELSAPGPTPKLENHPLLAVIDCLFSIISATLHNLRLYPPSIIKGLDAHIRYWVTGHPDKGVKSDTSS